MNRANSEFLIAQANAARDADAPAFADAVAAAIEVGVVVPSRLRSTLESAGYTVIQDEATLAEYGFNSLATLKRVVVQDKDGIVAMGAASDHDEAILAAALGWFRENPANADDEIPAGIATAPQPEG